MTSINEIINKFGGTFVGNSDLMLNRVASLKNAEEKSIAFFNNTKHLSALKETNASVVILKLDHADLTSKPKIITENPYAYFAKLSTFFNPKPIKKIGISKSANINLTVTLGLEVSIGENVVIGQHVSIGNNVTLGHNVVIEEFSSIGQGTTIDNNVTILSKTKIGTDCHIFSGVVIGGDGFGYAEENSQWVKIPQVGNVVIGNNVDIGANTTIDRGALDDTIIEDGVKMDNLIQIGHNCIIKQDTVIAGCVGIAGSAVVGKNCKIGGAAMILGHLEIADGVTISPGSMITRSIRQADTYTAIMPFQKHNEWLKTAVSIRQINELSEKVKSLEQTINAINKGIE
jgi:UDP-3-O-[3-hydroxymyristoyl] glucosamine N-acyltransferase